MREMAANMLWLCIDECNDTNIRGTMYSTMQIKPMEFHDIDQMMLRADQLFDKTGYPQSFQKKRSMLKEEVSPYTRLAKAPQQKTQDITMHQGKQGTFIILVTARQFANWQGALLQKDFTRIKEFHDVLGLLNILMEKTQKV